MIIRRIIKWRCISFSSHKESVAYISHKKCPSRIITHMFFAKSLKEKYLQFSILPVVKAILDIVLIFLSNSLDQVRFFGQASCKTSQWQENHHSHVLSFVFTHVSILDSSAPISTDTSTHTYTLIPTHTYRDPQADSHTESESAKHSQIQTLRNTKTQTDSYKHTLTHTWTLTSFGNFVIIGESRKSRDVCRDRCRSTNEMRQKDLL